MCFKLLQALIRKTCYVCRCFGVYNAVFKIQPRCHIKQNMNIRMAFAKFCLLCWKTYKICVKNIALTVVNVVIPVLIVFSLVWIRQYTEVRTVIYPTVRNSYEIENFPESLCIQLECENRINLYYTPSSCAGLTPVFKHLRTRMENISNEINLVGFANEADMVRAILGRQNISTSNYNKVFAALSFYNVECNGNLPKRLEYSIRLPAHARNAMPFTVKLNPFDQPKWYTEFTFPTYENNGPREWDDKGLVPGYYREGFLTLQYHVDWAIVMATMEQLNKTLQQDIVVKMQQNLFPPYIGGEFVFILQIYMPLAIALSFTLVVLFVVRELVHEKETGMKDYLVVYGISHELQCVVWWSKFAAMLVISVTLMTIMLCSTFFSLLQPVLTHINAHVMFLFLAAYSLATVSFAFVLSMLFKRANSAAIASAVVFLVCYLPHMILQFRYSYLNFATKLVLCLNLNFAMGFGIQIISMLEGSAKSLTWATISESVSLDDKLTLTAVVVMMLVDAVLYMAIALVIEKMQHSGQSFRAFLLSWCGCIKMPGSVSLDRERFCNYSQLSTVECRFDNNPLDHDTGIQISHLTKVYTGMGDAVRAVDDVSMSMRSGQITVILGHNGAGKTSLISMIVGVLPPTSGKVLINGIELSGGQTMDMLSVGYCPQHNVFFPSFTVQEHLYFFQRLKNCQQSNDQLMVEQTLRSVRLTEQRHVTPHLLSGGQQRRLVLAIALIGDSKVVVLDEPTASLDPESRLEMRDILIQQRQARTIVMTTHYMDEADSVADQIAIISSGSLVVADSPLALRLLYGAHYRLSVAYKGDAISMISDLILKALPSARLFASTDAELTFLLPAADKAQFVSVLTSLEMSPFVLSVGISMPTMEDVFLRLTSSSAVTGSEKEDTRGSSEDELIEFDSTVQHIRGVALVWMQIRALMWKNWLLLARSRKQTMVQLLMPAIIAAIALTNLPFMVPPVVNSLPFVLNLDRFGANVVVYSSGKAPVQSEATENLGLSYASQFDIGSPTKVVDMHTESQRNMFIEYMLDRCLRGVYWFTHTYIVGAEFVKDVSKHGSRETIIASAFFNNQAFHTPAISLGAVMNAILVHASGDTDYHITTVNHPLPITPSDILDLRRMEFFAFPLNVNIVMALCFVLSTITLTIVKERASQLKHCQLLTGLSSSVYWLTITICYISMFAVMFALLIFMFYLFNIEAYINGGRVKLVILLCTLFTWSSLPMTYLLTFVFNVPSTALVYTAILYLLIGPVSLMLGDIMLFPVVNLVTLYGHFNAIMTAISPAYCLCKGMQNIYLNDAALEACGSNEITFFCSLGIDSPCCPDSCVGWCLPFRHDYFAWDGYSIGRQVWCLFMQGCCAITILCSIESNFLRRTFFKLCQRLRYYCSHRRRSDGGEDVDWGDDSAVLAERQLITTSSAAEMPLKYAIRVVDVSKWYNSVQPALSHVTLGLVQGEHFGLLGVNGAGKTTLFRLLTALDVVFDGQLYIGHQSLSHTFPTNVGYCPQDNALSDMLTGREMLTLMGRLRGLSNKTLSMHIDSIARCLLLEKHIDRLTYTYSGGTKRKLNLALAIIGQPQVVLLDEPTCGMDPAARRAAWRAIEAMRCTILLTSHSLEECEALCSRLAIMVAGQLRCLGTAQQLKARYSQGYTVTVRVTSGDEPDKLATLDRYMSSVLHDRCSLHSRHASSACYSVTCDVPCSRLFAVMEAARTSIAVADYTVTQTTLEQVFVALVSETR